MTKTRDPQEIRDRIEQAKQELARTQGEEESLTKWVEKSLEELRKTLDCEAGKEREALEGLRAEIEADMEAVEELLDKADQIRGEQ